MILKIGHGRQLPLESGEHTIHEIAEGLSGNIDIVVAAMQEIHRHIEDIIDPLFIAEIGVEHTGRNTASRSVGIRPGMRPRRQEAGGLAILEGRVCKQRRRHRLECERGTELLAHVGLVREVEVHLHRAGTQHHIKAKRADLRHVTAHDPVAAFRHEADVFTPCNRMIAKAHHPDIERFGCGQHMPQVPSGLAAGLVNVVKRRT